MLMFIHVETGGLSPDYSLLEVAAVVTDEEGNEKHRLYLKTKPVGKEPKYVISPKALAANGIDLSTHDKEAVDYNVAADTFFSFLEEVYRINNFQKVTLIGWSLFFTMQFVYDYLITKEDLIQYTKIRNLDLYSMFEFEKMRGGIPYSIANIRSALSWLSEERGIEFVDDGTAINDCELFRTLLFELVNKDKD